MTNTTDQPMTISRICDRLFVDLCGAFLNADDGLEEWYDDGLKMAHKIETIAKGEENARRSNTAATDNGRAEGKESTAESGSGV